MEYVGPSVAGRRRSSAAVVLALATATLCAPSAAETFESVRNRIEQAGLRSVEATLAALPGPFRSRYALMFDSRSVQGASFENPRAILYGADARFVLTFNGDPAQAGYDAIETMEYDERTGGFVYREIRFPRGADATTPVYFSEPNPARCGKCHGEPARPIWDTHPTWPGAYGERYRAALSEPERRGMRAFLAGRAAHPRYRQLLGTERLADPETFRPSARADYDGSAREPANAELGNLLAALNVRAIARQLTAHPQFDRYAYALLATADRGCGPVEPLYPARQRATVRDALASFRRATEAANAAQTSSKATRVLSGARGGYDTSQEIEDLVALRFVVESGLGVDTGGWTLALEKPSFDFSTTWDVRAAVSSALFREASARDGRLADYADLRSGDRADKYCAYLATRSAAALDGTRFDMPISVAQPSKGLSENTTGTGPRRASAPAAPALLAACAACHEQSVGPGLPFGDPEALRPLLGMPGYPRGTLLQEIRYRLSPAAGARRMPRGRNVDPSERLALETYLENLANTAAPGR